MATTNTQARIAALLALSALMNPAHAEWPTVADAPLVVGPMQAFVGFAPSVVATAGEDLWVAWQDSICQGDLRVQRVNRAGLKLAPDGLAVQPDPTCGFVLPPALAPSGPDAVLSRAIAQLDATPLLRVSPDGAPAWGDGVLAEQALNMGGLLALAGGDTLVVARGFDFLRAFRLDPSGKPVWDSPTDIPSSVGANFEVLAMVTDGVDGAFVFWIAPSTYRRTIRVTRILSDGSLAWPDSIRPVPAPPLGGASRHTDPVALADGVGGAFLLWTRGFEQVEIPTPLLMQRIGPDASLSFDIEGQRVSLANSRQFDPRARVDQATGDLLVAWRDGPFSAQTVSSQRLTADGDRLWGDNGVIIEPADSLTTFDAAWLASSPAVAVGRAAPASGDAAVLVHRLDGEGAPLAAPTPVSGDTPAAAITLTQLGDGLGVVWRADAPGFDDLIVAQRLRADGSLGGPGCTLADLAPPTGVLDLADLGAFVAAFIAGDPLADLALPLAVLDLADAQAFVGSFVAGCP